jgi:hypothetical protein
MLGDGSGNSSGKDGSNGAGAAPPLLKTFYEHPAINPLYEGAYVAPGPQALTTWPTPLPSYIPARSFALAALDMAAAGGPPSQLPGPASGTLAARARAYGAYLGPSMLASQLRLVLDTVGNDDQRVLDGLAAWYDAAMDRVSGRYKRRTLGLGLVCGFLIAAVLNVNPLAIVNDLRQSGVRAEQVAQRMSQLNGATMTPDQAAAELGKLDVPIGWTLASVKNGDYIRSQVLGWLAAGFAAALGAPFWFDILNRLTIVRATVKPHEKSPEEPALERAAQQDGRVAPLAAPQQAAAAQDAVAAAMGSAAPAAPAANAGPAGEPPGVRLAGFDNDADTCTCDLDHTGEPLTPDHELPLASGGIASGGTAS